MNIIDNLLNKITMYSLMLYFLMALVAIAVALAFLGLLPYSPWYMLLHIGVLYASCKALNPLFAKLFNVKANWESSAITALILSLIIGPVTPLADIWKLVVIGAIAMLSKFLLVYQRRHLFNPAAVAVVIGALTLGMGASWWVGTSCMLPFVLLGGLLFLRKTRWFHLSATFIVTYLLTLIGWYSYSGFPAGEIHQYILNTLLYSPLLFFSVVMLTEPLTMPGGKKPRMIYAGLIAVLTVLLPTMFMVNYGLELSLLIGNVVLLVVYGNTRRFLKFIEQKDIAANTTLFKFLPDKKLKFKPGQFLLWTLPHEKTDMRGHRRYFSIASSPQEEHIMLVTKFFEPSSSFKQSLKTLSDGEVVMAGSLDGDFVLPEDSKQPIVFIAGGVGVAPFRSMIQDMVDNQTHRPITLFYSNNTIEEISFRELFEQAEPLGVKVFYTLTDMTRLPENWTGKTGYVDGKMITPEVPNYLTSLYYVSGPDPMVRAMKKVVLGMGIPTRNIKADYFPGYA